MWEHQALTRARFSAGDRAIGKSFEAIRTEVLCLRRELDTLRTEVKAMRKKMSDAHGSKVGEFFDLKHDSGGLVDVEFLIQYLVLGHSHTHPQLTGNLGNIALLRMAGELDLIPLALATACADSYRELRRLQHRQRLNDLQSRVPLEEAEAARRPVIALWRNVFGE